MSEPNLDAEPMQNYLAECREHLASIETDLLPSSRAAPTHSSKGGAGFSMFPRSGRQTWLGLPSR